MRAAALDQGDVGKSALAQAVAETGGKLETRRSAADDDDSMPMMVAGRRHEIRKPLLARARRLKDEPEFVLQFRRL